MQVEYRLKLGQDEFLLSFEAKNEKDFFEQAAFYSNLPRFAPGGSDDLKIVFRKTKKGHRYYSLISEKERKEYKFGQALEANGNGLFGKGWEDAYQGDDEGDETQTQSVGILGQQAPVEQVATKTAPVGIQTATPVQQAPVQAAPPVQTQAFKMPTPITQQQTQPIATQPTTVAQPIQGATTVVQPQVSPQVAKVSTDVLKRFGIQPKS